MGISRGLSSGTLGAKNTVCMRGDSQVSDMGISRGPRTDGDQDQAMARLKKLSFSVNVYG